MTSEVAQQGRATYRSRYLTISAAILVGSMWTYLAISVVFGIYTVTFEGSDDLASLVVFGFTFAVPLMAGAAIFAAAISPLCLFLERFETFKKYPLHLILAIAYTAGTCATVYAACTRNLCYF